MSPSRRSPLSNSGTEAQALHSLLVPVDLTPASDRVLGRVARLPLTSEARVTLLHVVPGSLPPGERRKAVRDAKKALLDEVRHLREQLPEGVSVVPLVKVGAAAKEIADAADELEVELIVMGRGGGRALRDAFLGSTAARVVRRTRLPVLVVRQAPRAAYRRPALALDLDQAAHDVVRLMSRVLPPPCPRVEVIHAFDIPYAGLVYPSLSADDAEERKEEHRVSATRELTKLLAAAFAKAKLRPETQPSFRLHVQYGSPRTVVDKVVKKVDSDLLVLGTRGYSGAAYAFLGTVAGDLLRAAQCDVLVVPPSRRSQQARAT
jgi:nucleotide-binding universal stress UspA family protein